MTRLATDSELDQALFAEAQARRRDRLVEERRRVRRGRLPTETPDFRAQRSLQTRRVDDGVFPAPVRWDKRIDDLSLIDALAAERTEEAREVRSGVVTENAGLVPNRPLVEAGTFLH